MNVLHVIGSLDQRSGGPIRAVLDLSATSEALGLHSELIGLGPIRIQDNPLPPELIHTLTVRGPQKYGYSPDIRSWCRTNLARFDGVILHGMWAYSNWAVSQECRAAGVPYVCFPHGMLDLWPVRGQGLWKRAKKSLYWHWIERDIVAASKAVFFTAERELQNARRTFALPYMHSLIVVPYGMSPPETEARILPSQHVRISPDIKVALFLGRLHPKKRLDLLIEAWKTAALPPEWRLVLAGPGEPQYLRYLSALITRYKVTDSIQFTGAVAGLDKQYLLRRAAWFLLPSEHENFGIAALEAITSGCAVAISDQVYLGDCFPEASEILPLNVRSWARFMAERMTHDLWRDTVARKTWDKLGASYGISEVTRGWVNAIQKVLGPPDMQPCTQELILQGS